MTSPVDKRVYFFRHQLDSDQLPANVTSLLTKRYYISQLIIMHITAGCIILLSGLLQLVSIFTTEWYVLNVNEFIPTAKGGLWTYCFIGSHGNNEKYTCMRYEELPNFSLFVNQRLHDSRILLVCSCGFTFFLLLIELFSLLYLLSVNKGDDKFDMILANCRRPKHQLQEHKIKRLGLDENLSNNSTRFTSSFVLNENHSADKTDMIDEQINELYDSILRKPDGYAAFLASSLINSIGGFMDFVLKVAGFSVFDSYIKYLLSYNTVFLTYRSYSYWFLVVSICIHFFYWLFKVISARYIVKSTRKLIETRENLYSIICRSRSKSTKSMSSFDTTEEGYMECSSKQAIKKCESKNENKTEEIILKKSFVFDLNAVDETEFSGDDLSHSTFSNDSDKYKQDQLKAANDQNKPKNSNYLTSTNSFQSNISNNGNSSTNTNSDNEPTIVRF